MSNQVGQLDPLEARLLQDGFVDLYDDDVKNYLLWMDSFEPNEIKYFEALGESINLLIPSIEKPPSL